MRGANRAEGASSERFRDPNRVVLTLPDELIDSIAHRSAALVIDQIAIDAERSSPYLTVREAAEFLRCTRQRIYDLLSSRRLTRFKDGTRVLIAREELERHVRQERSR
jgi:excisionase family DNA binding protein